MFGHVDYVIKAAPGTGIVSAAVLQSDCLDEIDWEWLGGDDTQAQSNYFGKGITTTGYNRGAFHAANNNHDTFHTYSIDWTADQIVWSIDGTTVRVLTQEDAESGQYPQTPMYVKLGAWAGGDSSNPQGTIEWAGGLTDYSAGPFTMYVKSVQVTDYSTGSKYSYSGTSGTWDSIVSDGGKIDGNDTGTPASTVAAPAATSHVSNSAPLAFSNSDTTSSDAATRTGWPWSGTATATAVTIVSASTPGLTSQYFLCSSSVVSLHRLTCS
jgi:beta-glucanase (GH16 family)